MDGQTGLGEQSRATAYQWTAEMISPAHDAGDGHEARCVATSFTAKAGGTKILRASAQGLYRVFLNGTRVGEDLLTPGWTNYDDRIAYQSYDVSDLVTEGENRIEIWLGDGWYRSPLMARAVRPGNLWGDRVGAIAEITEGETVLCRTDGSWSAGLIPVTRSGIYYGEDYDARLEGAARDESVEVLPFDTGRLVPQEAPTVRHLAPLEPVESWTDAEGRSLHDFGQNVGGLVRITVKGKPGAEVYVEHSEVLGPDRAFDNRNYRSARGAYRYTLKGEGDETYEPVFSFMGYRFARITVTGDAEVTAVTSFPISSVHEIEGGVTTGEPAVDRLVQNTAWSLLGNFIEVPTDCPQRDERMGWTGDAQVFAGTACWMADVKEFFRKYLRDVMHDQRENGAIPHYSPDATRVAEGHGDWAGSTGWGDVITEMPWQLYLHYGDTDALRECFPAMLKWLDYMWNISGGPVIHPNAEWPVDGFTFGDWLQPTGDNRKPRPTIGEDCAATISHFISVQLTSRIAGILGEEAEAQRLAARAEQIKAAFAHEFIAPSGRLGHNDQTSYALALLHDLVPEEHVPAATEYFRKSVEDAHYLIGTGFIGTPALLPALCKVGLTETAEKVFLNRKVPGWLYQVDQGATTIWERWDAIGPDGTIYEPSMNSYNHYAYGAVCQWLFEDVAGVTPSEDGPGFDKVRLSPRVLPGLGHVEMWHDCRHGRIEAGWRIEEGQVTYRVTLPEGVEAHADDALGGGTHGPGTHEFTFALGG
ncbi:alpha-L-rhamnosidase [Allosediminivita pacifica]|uniref:alpha-L-rhamnosidase n=1 Tax=Allosediminivita pacifica TaxID=1267769 RepID=A0A2T6ATH3_9RHOB|nr:alpha-L-rhamnosidase [Allosediminivita pacifica]PTX47121.1 alpha-L-rhamnosidase [Allosediminivita pacifica]GGB10084.1 alpha-L-rhamnosidase [Allosediminivita pacifica]